MSEDSKTRIRVAGVRPVGEYTLRIRWVNGRELPVDLRDIVHRLKGLRALRDLSVFARGTVGEGGDASYGPGISISAPLACWNSVSSRAAVLMRSSSSGGAGAMVFRSRQQPRRWVCRGGKARTTPAASAKCHAVCYWRVGDGKRGGMRPLEQGPTARLRSAAIDATQTLTNAGFRGWAG